jgi:hypothetical protein
LSDLGERIFDAGAVAFCAWMIVDGLRTGKVRLPVPYVDADYYRAVDPVAYWTTLAVLALGALVGVTLFASTLR